MVPVLEEVPGRSTPTPTDGDGLKAPARLIVVEVPSALRLVTVVPGVAMMRVAAAVENFPMESPTAPDTSSHQPERPGGELGITPL